MLRLEPLAVGQSVEVGPHRVEVLPARHTVPAVGYAITRADRPTEGAWVFTGDTGPNPELWPRLSRMPIDTLVIETAFRDDEQALAEVSQHLCPAMLAQALASVPPAARVFVTHIKPGEVDAVMAEIIADAGPGRVTALVSGQLIQIGCRQAR